MDNQRKCLRIGAAVIGCAVVLRLLSVSGIRLGFDSREAVSTMLFFSTGRLVRLAQPQQPEPATEPVQETAADTQPTEPDRQTPVFTAADTALLQVRNTSGYGIDLGALLETGLNWDLTQDAPAVLILHTHGSESYTKTEEYTESSAYRTLDSQYNVVSIGDRLAQQLEAGGIQVIHDRTLHDQPSYNGSYNHARAAMEEYLTQYPTIRMVLDIHRDAAVDSSGNQINYTVDTADGSAAQLMLVMGTDAGGYEHPNWRENLALSVKLYAGLEKRCPGICRPLQLRTARFNQDLCPGMVLVEVGAAGNTRQEALLAADILAQEILDLAYGT